MAASRFRSTEHLYHYGVIRRTDWLPVGSGEDAAEQLERSHESCDEDPEYDMPLWMRDSESEVSAASSDYLWDSDAEHEDNQDALDALAASSGPSDINLSIFQELEYQDVA